MASQTTYRTNIENQRVYNLIWSQMPEMQNRNSSSWWFFLLFPKTEEGYGPQQIMLAIAARVGERIRVNDIWLPGIDLNRPIVDGVDKFHALNVGWYGDSEGVQGDIINEAASVVLSEHDQVIRSWSNSGEGSGHGIEIRASQNRPLALETIVQGPNGSAHFEAWGDLDSKNSSPHESMNIDTPLGGTHFIAWRRMNFEGEFNLGGKNEHLSGICYFQRPCVNVPLFPWKWIWSLFPDGSMFSAYIPYVGFNLLRKGYKFFKSERLEQMTLPIAAKAFWDWPGPSEEIIFNKASITPLYDLGPYPQFDVRVSNNQGDALSFLAQTYGHACNYIDRPVLGNRAEIHWNYNEFMFRMANLNGRVSGKEITYGTMGQNFGNLEYAWGLGL
ncbi:MAG: hypothetical protein ACK2T1_11810 [Candidatus Promineifilaceae bacterium]|jgi:hypothetical protein